MPEKFKIKGSSMNPSYKDGDIVEIDSFPNYFKDDVVVLKMPELGYVIKRIEGFNRGLIILRGDNKKLHSSVCDQLHRKQDIFGKVVS
jgi:phage repressor protein C with HTH and peptisase S24 domain